MLSFFFFIKREKIMPTKIWLKPEQLDLYIKHLERFRDLYSKLVTLLPNKLNYSLE